MESLRSIHFHMRFKLAPPREGRVIEGFASTPQRDRHGEVVEVEAFRRSLAHYLQNPILTFMHDWRQVIGKVMEVSLKGRGLYVKAEISSTASKVWTLIEEGALRAFSIGFNVLKERVINGINHIEDLDLFEISVVSIPANKECLFSIAKALEMGTDLQCKRCSRKRPDLYWLVMEEVVKALTSLNEDFNQ